MHDHGNCHARPDKQRDLWRTALVANPKWGTKRICQSCGTKFYDLTKSPIVCPSCGTEFDPEALLKSRRPRSAPKAEPAPKPKKPNPAATKEGASEETGEEVESEEEEADAAVADGDRKSTSLNSSH